MSSEDAAVGSINHILQTAFKDVYDERNKINLSKEKKILRENKLKELEEKRIAEEQQRLEEEKIAAELNANKKPKKGDPKAAVAASEIISRAPSHEASPPEDEESEDEEDYQNPVDLLPLSAEHKAMLSEKIQSINSNIQTSSSNAEGLLNYLTQQRNLAREQEVLEEENLKKQGIMIGQHIPSLVSKLEVNPSVLQNFDNYSSNLIITRDLIEQNREKNLRRTGNLPISDEVEIKFKQRKANKGSTQLVDDREPNYLATTGVMKERNSITREKFVTFLSQHDETIRTKKFQTMEGRMSSSGPLDGNATTKPKKPSIPKRDYGQSAIEKEQDQQILKTIQHKLNYLRNPRNSPNAVNRTLVTAKRGAPLAAGAEAGGGGFGKQADLPMPPHVAIGHPSYPPTAPASSSVASAQSSKRSSSHSTISKTGSSLFLTEPSVIIFNSYDIGQKYTASISFRNISSVSRSLRVIPPSTKNFSLAPLQYPSHSKAGIVAPGMVILSEISFFPQSLKDYYDILHVETEGGSYTVPLYGKRNPPQLSLPSLIDIGSCLVGDALRTSIPCTNNGGHGKFKLLKQEWYPEIPEDVDYSGCIRCPPFTLYPLEFELSKHESTQITVEFIPLAIEIYQIQFVILFDNEQYISVTLKGEGKQIDCHIIEINSVSLALPPSSPSAPSAASAAVSSPSATLIKDLYFHDCFIGTEHEQEIMVCNSTGLSLEYEWIWVESKAKDVKMNALHKLMIQDEQQEEKVEEKFQKLTQQQQKKKKKTKQRRNSRLSSGGGAGTGGGGGEEDGEFGFLGIEDDLISTHDDFTMDFEDNESSSCSSMGGYSVSPGRGVFPSYGSSPFVIKFRPSSHDSPESGRMVLVLRDVTHASLPGPQQASALATLEEEQHGPFYRLQSWLDEIGSLIHTKHTKHELDDLFLKGYKPQNVVMKKINLETLWNLILNHSGYSLHSYLVIALKYVFGRLLSKCYRWIHRNAVDREIADDDSIFGGLEEDEEGEGGGEGGGEDDGSLGSASSLEQRGGTDANADAAFAASSSPSGSISESNRFIPSALDFPQVIHWDPSSASSASGAMAMTAESDYGNSNGNGNGMIGSIFPRFSVNLNKEKLFEEDYLESDELSGHEIPFNITHNLSKYLDIDTTEGRKLRKTIWLPIATALSVLGPLLCGVLDEKVKHESIDFLQRLNRINLPILDVNVTASLGIIPSIYVTPPLLTVGGTVGIGMETKGIFTLHNSSPIMNEVTIDATVFHCEGLKNKENVILSFSSASASSSSCLGGDTSSLNLILHPNSTETITVTMLLREIGEFRINIPVIPASPYIVINDLMIQATVIGPKIRFESPELNLGLLSTGMESISILSFMNDSDIPLYFNLSCQLDSLQNLANPQRRSQTPKAGQQLSSPSPFGVSSSLSNRDRDDDTHSIAHSARSQMTENSSDSYAIENTNAVVTFDPPSGSLDNGALCQIKVKCIGGKFPQRVKGVIECALTDSTRLSSTIPSQFLSLRGEVQAPLTILFPRLLELGNLYVNTPIHFQITLQTLTSLPSKFKFDRPGGDSSAYRLKYSEKAGELQGKETRVIDVEMTSLIAGVTDDVIACKVFGLSTPLGFQIKAITKGIQVEFLPLELNQPAPPPLASSHEPQYPGPGPVPDPAPIKPLDFSNTVTLYERVIRRFALRNLSAMVVNYELKPRKYDVGDISLALETETGEGEEDGAEGGGGGGDGVSVSSSLKEPPVSGQGLLVPREDGENRFYSQEGKRYIGSLLKRRQDKHYLTLGLGASYSFEPKNGQLKPWGVVTVTVLSRNDMPGTFDDDIVCDIKDHRKLYFPMKMTVLGCPLMIERDSYGMSTYTATATAATQLPAVDTEGHGNTSSSLPTQVNVSNTSPSSSSSPLPLPLMLQMGCSTVNSEAIVREFRVRNNGSSPALIKWKLRSVASQVNGPIKFELKLGGGGGGGRVRVKSQLLFWDDVAKDSPFEVEPKATIIPPYSRKNFKVKFFRTTSVVNELALLTGGISFDNLFPREEESRSQTTSRTNLHDDTWSNGSRSPGTGLSARGGGGGSMTTTSLLAGTHTKVQSPSYNISLYLKANIMLPVIKVDKHLLSTTGQKVTYALNHPIALKTDAPHLYSRSNASSSSSASPVCKKVIVFTNPIPALLAFSVSTEGPFTVRLSPDEAQGRAAAASGAVIASAASGGGGGNGSSSSSVGSTCVLQSNASVRFLLSFLPKKELRQTLLHNTSLTGMDATKKEVITENEKGNLIISFSTGQQIYIPLSVTIATPFLTASSPRMSYGVCHVTRACQGVLLLSNPTDVIAKWTVIHVPETNKSKKISSIRVKGFENQSNAKPEDDPTVFEISQHFGEISGPTVSPTAATYCPPNDLNRSPSAIIEQRPVETSWKTSKLSLKDTLVTRHELSYQHAIDAKYPLPLQISFKPKRNAKYRSRYRFVCEFGNVFDVLLEGEGTYEEHEHRPINPTPR